MKSFSPFKSALLYAIFAGLWILVSSHLLIYLIDDAVLLSQIEIAKGFLFVFITSVLCYTLLKRWYESIAKVESMKAHQESHAFIVSVLDSLTAHIAVLDEQGVIIAVNEAWREFGKENCLHDLNHSCLGVNYLNICKKAAEQSCCHDAHQVYVGILSVLKHQQEHFYFEYSCHSPTEQRWFSMNVSRFQRSQEGVVVCHENITERKQAELKLQESQSRLQFALEISHTGGWRLNLNDFTASRTLEHDRIFGYESLLPEWTYPMFLNHVVEEDRNHVDSLFQQAIATQSDWNFECRIRRVDGELRWIWAAGKHLFDNEHNVWRMAGIVQDINNHKKVEEALIASEKEFRLLAESMPQIVWATDANGKNIYCNQQWTDYTGFSLEDAYNDDCWNKLFHPDERQRVWNAWQDAVYHNTNFALEFRLRRFDGKYRWWLSRGTPVFDEQGKVYKWFGSCTDIHDLKQTEQLLREKQRLLTDSQAIAHIGSWLRVINSNEIIWTEETFHLFGVSLSEQPITTEKFLTLLHPDDIPAMQGWINDCLTGKQPTGLEFRTRPVDNQYHWLLGNGILETDADGKPLRMIGTVQDITERKKAEQTIFNLAYYDPLTELPNRHLMLDRLKQTLLSRMLQHHHGAILFINIDNFRNLNDTQGHTAGDLLLLAISKRLQTNVHQDDTIARIGGDEFVLILEALDENTEQAAAQAKSVALRILNAIKLPFNLQGYEYQCSASIGISLFQGHNNSVDELLKQADIAMHQAKRQGKNTVCFFDSTIQSVLESQVQMESWMRKALDGQYQLYYQIQVNHQNHVIGAETLIRWQHPKQGMIPPSEFIALAEKTGLILPIGLWVLETACAQLKAWETNPNTQYLVLAVNISAKQFYQIDFVEQLLELLQRTQINPEKLKLELTESILLDNIEETINKMKLLKAHGIKFSLDDFGTGFSSLSYLKRLPFDQLKIDQSFVRDALDDVNDAAIIQTIIALGQSLGLEVIAEGVETLEQKQFLELYGCKHYQGYLFSKPLPLDEFEKLLETTYLPE